MPQEHEREVSGSVIRSALRGGYRAELTWRIDAREDFARPDFRRLHGSGSNLDIALANDASQIDVKAAVLSHADRGVFRVC